ncbi:MAG: cytochrome-c peroxidase [Nitrospina sp.]|jgi:cytochrome c peroxidase|nr:cytochrome-c peroxidase [Nitrospina sp.]
MSIYQNAGLGLALLILAICPSLISAGDAEYQPLPAIEHPADNPWSKEKHQLGKMLFFDPRLSGNNRMSCATCHNPSLGWSDGLPRTLGRDQRELGRNSPSIINSGYFGKQFWDGRADSLEEQALVPIMGPTEMDQNLDELIDELKAIPYYYRKFKKVFGASGVTAENIAKALATFERSVVSRNSPYDQYQQGDVSSLSKSAVRGMKIFFGKGQCTRCHQGSIFADNKFHNIGLQPLKGRMPDLGRFKITERKEDKWVFRTPGLRDISRTSPYMHDGRFKTLEEVIDFFDRGGDPLPNKSLFLKPLGLKRQEKKDLESFLIALEGRSNKVFLPNLP